MPYLKIQTNQDVDDDKASDIVMEASRLTASILGKPETYVMVNLQDKQHMAFAGSDEPLAYLELKSLGLPEDKTDKFSSALCEFLRLQLGIAPGRVYIEFANGQRHMWGWDGKTF